MKRHQLLIRALVCTILLAAPAVARAQPPGPVGSMSANPARTVSLSWPFVTGATYYYIWVTDSSGVPRYQKWHTASELKCGADQTTTCQISVPVYLLPGLATWWVQTWNAAGYGPWSPAHTFDIPGPLSAVVSSTGELVRGNAVSAQYDGFGSYRVNFGRSVVPCTFNVNAGSPDTVDATPLVAVSESSEIITTRVIVRIFNLAGAPVAGSFHLSVVCD